MTTELYAVAGNAALLLLLLLIQQLHHDLTKGFGWTLGPRDDQSFGSYGERIRRTILNQMESTAMFTPIALVVVMAQLHTSVTATAGVVFVALRGVYAATYIMGVPYLRSMVWTAAIACLCVVGWPLFF